ncbi:MAG: hypothetical protein M3Q69_03445 [Acidobacteriota bacterium]|nr:hypothetical protein [Acidobacteriota bacterium]
MFLAPLVLLASILRAGPEQQLTPPVPNASPGLQSVSAIAASGNAALLVWSEEARLRGVRLDRDGHPLDAPSFALASQVRDAAIARADDGWLVIWRSTLGGLHARFVRGDGSMTSESELVSESYGTGLSVAYDGEHFLVVFNLYSKLGAMILRRDGSIERWPFAIAEGGTYGELDTTALPRGFAVVTTHGSAETADTLIEAIRLESNGDRYQYDWLDRTSAIVHSLHVVAQGETLVAVWAASGAIGEDNIVLAREEQPLRIVAHGTMVPQDVVAIAGKVYALLFDHGVLRLAAEDGTSVALTPPPAGALQRDAGAASFGDRALIAASASAARVRDPWVSVADATQELAPATRIATDPLRQDAPAIARAANGEALAVWNESGGATGDETVAMPLNAEGRALRERPVPVGAGSSSVALASDGNGYLVVFAADTLTYRVVHHDGTPASEPHALVRATSFDAVWTGSDYVIAYAQTVSTTVIKIGAIPMVARVSREGVLLSNEPLSDVVRGIVTIEAAATANATLVSWIANGQAIGRLLYRSGSTSGVFTIAQSASRHATAANGDRFAVASVSSSGSIERAIVNENGTVSVVADTPLQAALDELAIAPWRDGFVLAYRAPDGALALPLDRDARISGDAVALGNDIAIASMTGGANVLIAYTRTPPQFAPYTRVFTRLLFEGEARRRGVRS